MIIQFKELNAELELETHIELGRYGDDDEAYFDFNALIFKDGRRIEDMREATRIFDGLGIDLSSYIESFSDNYDFSEMINEHRQGYADQLYDQMKEDGWN